jgi:S1-C subfamily serine protease
MLGFLLSPASGARIQAAEPDIRRDATVVAVEKVMPSVVNIATETIIHVRDPFEEIFRLWDPYHRRQPPNSQYSLGSGVVIDEAGYLLTNDHVVRRADKIVVKFCTGTNVYSATVVRARTTCSWVRQCWPWATPSGSAARSRAAS